MYHFRTVLGSEANIPAALMFLNHCFANFHLLALYLMFNQVDSNNFIINERPNVDLSARDYSIVHLISFI